MGDRTYVNLYVPRELGPQARDLLDGFSEDDERDTNLWWFSFEEVNYGELDRGDQQALIDAGIAYDMGWEAGSEYGAGTKSVRFTPDGELEVKEVYDENLGVYLDDLLKVIDDHEQLKAVILKHKERTVPRDWENQVEYGKLYLARQLIAPKGATTP